MMKPVLLIAAGAAIAVTTACSSGSSGARTPDEFRVVTKAPLIVPPEYALRPPQAGGSLPAEVDPSRTEIATAFEFPVSSSASYMTGTTYSIDGGWSAFGDSSDESLICIPKVHHI